MPRFIRLFALILALGMPMAANATEKAGTVSRLKGAAIATQAGESRALAVGAEVFIGDRLSTCRDTRIEMNMTDGTILTLGDHSTFILEDYGENRGAVMELVQGVLLSVSGSLAKLRDDGMTVRTPVATIGIRGTTFWGGQETDRLGVVMLEGTAVTVTTAGGIVELTEPNAGTNVTDATQAPTSPGTWSPERLAAAQQSVSFE